MKRYVQLEHISDGKLYTAEDMVKAGCHNCAGCHACCQGMGTSVILDPLDIHRLCTGLSVTFEQLIASAVELNIADGIILPNLKMNGELEQCSFLNDSGRCSIHSFRPGICRLFPLGRYYTDDGSFKYFLQTKECPMPNKTKVRIRQWIGGDLKDYEAFICSWHSLLKRFETLLSEPKGIADAKKLNMYLLNTFYLTPYGTDFYGNFYKRVKKSEEVFLSYK